MAKKKDQDQPEEVSLTNMPPEGIRGVKGGRSVSGKDLSDSESSRRKGRKSSVTKKKLEEQAE